MSQTVTTTNGTITNVELLENIHCRYCGRIIFLDYSEFDHADPSSKPIPRNISDDQYHSCINKRMVRLYERGLL